MVGAALCYLCVMGADDVRAPKLTASEAAYQQAEAVRLSFTKDLLVPVAILSY